MIPKIISGESFKDHRGKLNFNNSFNAISIKRIYSIENNISLIRKWQGHKIEQRWFSSILGEFKIQLIKIDNWSLPNKMSEKITFTLSDQKLDILHIPSGYISSIESITKGARLLVMSDYKLNEINDEYKFSSDYFND